MYKNFDYLNTFPNFLTLQKTNFCWFLYKGLYHELLSASKTYILDPKTIFRVFGHEVKNKYKKRILIQGRMLKTLLRLSIPVDILYREEIDNVVIHKKLKVIIKLPLMTPYATFIINGYERIVLSQILRSPGVYFKKNNIKLKNELIRIADTSVLLSKKILILDDLHDDNSFLQQINFNQDFILSSLKYNNLISNNINIQLEVKVLKLFIKWLKNKKITFYKNLINYNFLFFNHFIKSFRTLTLIFFSRITITYIQTRIKNFLFLNFFSIFKKSFNDFLKNKIKYLKLCPSLNNKRISSKTNIIKYFFKNNYTATIIPKDGPWIYIRLKKRGKKDSLYYNYPLKNHDFIIWIQVNKLNKMDIISFLKKIGMSNLEIYHKLYHAHFFYDNKPLLIRSTSELNPYFTDSINDLDFLDIFDSSVYYLGQIGRLNINNRLNLQTDKRIINLNYNDIFGIIDKLIDLACFDSNSDDIDHLKNKRIKSLGELLQNLFKIGFYRLQDEAFEKLFMEDMECVIKLKAIDITLQEFFNSSQLSQFLDQTNPLAFLTHQRRISVFGPEGLKRDSISFSMRDIHPSQYGRICPIETTEGKNVGLVSSLTTCAKINQLGFLETPFWRVINGKVIKIGNPIYLTSDIEDSYKIAAADIKIDEKGYLTKNIITVRYKQNFVNVLPSDVDFIAVSLIQVVSISTSLIPFFEHNDANRALMGSNMQRQAIPLVISQKPIVGTGLENQIATNSGMTLKAKVGGIVDFVTANRILIKSQINKTLIYKLQKYLCSNQQTCINQRPIVWEGEQVVPGQTLADNSSIMDNELSLGRNVLVAYMPWHGYNYEDAILISERLIYDDIFTSINLEQYNLDIDIFGTYVHEKTTRTIPSVNSSELEHLDKDGVIKVGTIVQSGDILVGKIKSKTLTRNILTLWKLITGFVQFSNRDTSFRLPNGKFGKVIEAKVLHYKKTRKSEPVVKEVDISIAQIQKIQVGDKIAGRHGNKGVISKVLARQDMPFLPDGTPIDILLNPLGVPSRMNVGQLYECLLGFAGDKLDLRFKILPFDEMYGLETSRILINKKLRQASIKQNKSWIFNPYSPGKIILVDGRNGLEFENPITVGNAYMLKLIHLVDKKIHARSVGIYARDTQQPVHGKKINGGQRFGEMEVWALESYGSAFTLKELLTVKSDDIYGRRKVLFNTGFPHRISEFRIPESFKVLLEELRSLGLDINIHKLNKFYLSKNYDSKLKNDF
uniref:DNA-directed RNA polymerase subunit beta n=1 Tax=Nitzschia alba TaxID=2858 RepID=A0A5C0F425_NITAL|nr:DNA-directed RNA polymerase beta subunit [Nitzschia alba]QEI59558.1 DNA-directed RNA polymerase beta subunit [Nitzschia alba]